MKRVPLLKYCGNHSLEDIKVATNSSAHYLGFVFAESKRCVTPSEVKEWLSKVEVSQKLVGVFVNAPIDQIQLAVENIALDVIQCHGEETVEEILALKATFKQKVWKVIHHSETAINLMKQYEGVVDGYVIDSKVKGVRGGTGVTFDWSAIPAYKREAEKQKVPCFIAGGINVSTINELLQYDPGGIDLSSGIEVSGRKSEKIKKQFEERLFV
ncbi:N-(5'-phosphoribosyl)anthranilate isomerase [Anaerobacillus arseniciselenatis]|uniref:N-(5'-phosphoribosyl)anthranilate isomerase n=1 Tax=Anaerobacillus arseniciselenatis TaxID=85682 RepID=A0A1S2LU49_9BACI|nr:phosphoribosylanthranilate isomerase [Anaerobacillus arseniciselenatis]OIJ15844.1 N-(5'-phosphoribosyl)anthranilate isomerase [Anaerobacillus arseniciselenatis]